MTSLIDVIFLLLLFFMLGSTFTRFAEVELATGGAGTAPAAARPLFLQLAEDGLTLNGAETALADLPAALSARVAAEGASAGAPLPLLVALKGPVTAQRLADLLVALRGQPGLRAVVLEGRA